MEVNLKFTISFLIIPSSLTFLVVGCGDTQPLPYIETAGLDPLNRPLAENVMQIPECVKKGVDVELTKEGQPVEIVEEVAKDIRTELVTIGSATSALSLRRDTGRT